MLLLILTKDDILLYVSEIRFPKHRNGVEYKEYLFKELDSYISVIEKFNYWGTKALSSGFYDILQSYTPLIKESITAIKNSLLYYDKGDYLNSYQELFNNLDKTKEKVEFVDLANVQNYYRIRVHDDSKKLSRKELFHVPFHLRQYVNTSRFSLPGMPSLYLSTYPELCWYESGMPMKYYASKFKIVDDLKLKLIDFSIVPDHFAMAIDLDIRNNKVDRLPTHEDKLLEFLVMLPYRIASSVSVEDKNVTFIHEYVIPQMILSWIKNSSEFDGIRYHTVTNHKEAYDWNAYNIVLPIKNVNSEGYCSELADMFLISEPKYFSIKEFFKANAKLDKISEMYGFVQPEVYIFGRGELYEIEKILFSLINVIDEIISEESSSNIALMRSLDGLYLAFDNIVSDKDTFSAYMKRKSHLPEISDDIIERYYEKFSKFRVEVLIDFYRNGFLRMYDFKNFEKLY